MISFIHSGNEKFTDTGFLATSQLMLEEVASYIWAHSNPLIKDLTTFEDDVDIRLLNVLMQSICKQPEDTFIQMASSPKIDFYFAVFKQLQRTDHNLENSSFYLFHQLGKFGNPSLEQHSKSQFSIPV